MFKGPALLYEKDSSDGTPFTWVEEQITCADTHELLVENISAGLNPLDYKIPELLPFWLVFRGKPVGHDFCGKVVAVGSRVTRFKKGDIVFGYGHGMTKFTTAFDSEIGLVPEGISDMKVFGGLSGTCLTGLQCLRKANVFKIPGDRVLVIGASGGVGSAAVQICKAKNPAIRISAICSSHSSEYVKSIGADEVICYNQVGAIEAIPSDHFDAIIDTVTSPDDFDYVSTLYRCVKKNGRYIACNTRNSLAWVRTILGSVIPLIGYSGKYQLIMVKPNSQDLEEIAQLVKHGKLSVNAEYIEFSKESILQALSKLRGRHVRGKIIVKL